MKSTQLYFIVGLNYTWPSSGSEPCGEVLNALNFIFIEIIQIQTN